MKDRLRVRPPAVAGTFYPADPDELRAAVHDAFAGAVPPDPGGTAPRGLVVPHAGFVYSGPIAASAYLRIAPLRDTIRRVVLLGPSHRVPLRGMALSGADAWASPLGLVPLDRQAADALADVPWVHTDDRPHALEHSLEVQLPFLQSVLDEFKLLPIVVGDAAVDDVATMIEVVWTGPDTALLVSTDLSHYHRYADAVQLDARTVAAIMGLRAGSIGSRDACGARALRGLLRTAQRRRLAVEAVDVRNSGDTVGDKERVVGYGAFTVA